MKRILLSAFFLALTSPCSYAQTPSPASQALSSCITRSTTNEDKIVVARWVFLALATHPDLSGLANIPNSQRISINRQMGAVVDRLLLEACPNETRAALQADGQDALGAPFGTLGENAMEGITANPNVNAAMGEIVAYVDLQRLAV